MQGTDVLDLIYQKTAAIDSICDLAYAYELNLRPIYKKMGVPYTAFAILMYLAENPDKYTASDICKFKGIKPNLISVNVERLVKEGYLEREAIPGDRRSVRLICTGKAAPFTEQGRRLNRQFLLDLIEGLSEEDVLCLISLLDMIKKNVAKIKEKSEAFEND